MSNGDTDWQSWPPPESPDPNGMQTGSTAATATGLGFLAVGEGGTTIASILGLSGAPAKVLTAGISLQGIGRMSLSCAGFVLIGLGIVLNVASLVVRWQRAKTYEYQYTTAGTAAEERRRAKLRGGAAGEEGGGSTPPPRY
jgi:hypothetical protein